MRARLFCPIGPLKGSDFEVRGEATIGRGKGNTIVLKPRSVSSRHARIAYDSTADAFVLEDLGSLNGTLLDGAPVQEPQRLDALHVITIGDEHEFIFQDLGIFPDAFPEPWSGGVPEGTMAEQAPPLIPMAARSSLKGGIPEPDGTIVDREIPLLPEILAARPSQEEKRGRKPLLEVWLRSGEKRRIPLKPGETVLGRDSRADLKIANSDVSRRHAVLTVQGEVATVRDLGSRNRTTVGGVEISEEVTLEDGAELCFGSAEARFILGEVGEGVEEKASEGPSGAEAALNADAAETPPPEPAPEIDEREDETS